MTLKETLKGFAKYLTGEALIGAAETFRDTVDQTVARVIKASALFIIFLTGVVFFIIGLARFLQEYNGWVDGTGYALVGGILILLGFVVKALR